MRAASFHFHLYWKVLFMSLIEALYTVFIGSVWFFFNHVLVLYCYHYLSNCNVSLKYPYETATFHFLSLSVLNGTRAAYKCFYSIGKSKLTSKLMLWWTELAQMLSGKRCVVSGPIPSICFEDVNFSRVWQLHIWLKGYCNISSIPFADNFLEEVAF